MLTPAARVLLVYPPSRTQKHSSCPASIMMLGAVLERAGYEVHLLDANAASRRLSTAQVVEHVRQLRPDVVGVTLLTPLVKEAYRLAFELRDCGARLLAGGPHATLLPEEPVEHGFGATVVGEGEPTIVEAVEAMLGRRPLESVLGLVYRGEDGHIEHNDPRPLVADLDSLPLPARHLVNPADYGSGPNEALFTHVFTSRGCPARCAYCAGGLFGKKFRFRSADSVVDEMIAIHRSYGTRDFYFTDDAMSMNHQRTEQICRRLIDEQHGFTWSMMTRIDSVDEALLEMAAHAGCVQIDYGVESGNPQTLKRIHKPHTVEMVRRVIPLTHRHGIRSAVFFILGFPWEDAPAIDLTLQLMKDLSEYVVFCPAIASVLIPFPSTEIYERYKDQCGFASWWISDDRTFDAPRLGTHPFYQATTFRLGAVLDADFFHYSRKVKEKMFDVFRFMRASNLKERGFWSRFLRLGAFDLSRKLDSISPLLERAVFTVPLALMEVVRGQEA
ncbi:MAG: hypothetical protein A2V77_19380 [Anaeromyxobacter sp. RBG_16_69_14]|nr:MAG: hypothetical protein A2V77_19380 [Anaeromyxobacter sp. RBG_16_69_14]